MAQLINPRVLKGFRDFLPEIEISRRKLISTLEKHFESFGFVPIDTPVLEYAEVLLSKGGGDTDKQTYRFTDHGGRDVALRFDLTVPFARYVAAHRTEIAVPFKRYHIAKAWRGENTQKGRYREFIQCDFDIVGVDTASADLEIMLIIGTALRALGAEDIRLHFNHRGLFNALLSRLGLKDRTAPVLRIVDKLPKIGAGEVRNLLIAETDASSADTVLEFITPADTPRDTLKKMTDLSGKADGAGRAAERVSRILDVLDETGTHGSVVLDPSITRGLDYYTGIVFETFLDALPALGSVCSGGRYDNLTGLFMKEALPGVGASIGLDRLMAGLQEIGSLENRKSVTDILVMMMDDDLLGTYHQTAMALRHAGFTAEVYPEKRKLGAQFKYAESKGIPLALIIGSEEMSAGTVTLKDLSTRENIAELTLEMAMEEAKKRLGRI